MSPVTADTAFGRTLWQLAEHWATARAGEPFLVFATPSGHVATVTWQRFVEQCAVLRERLAAVGVGAQRTVVMALPNSPLTVQAWLAVIANGAVIQAIDADAGSVVFERSIRATAPVAVLTGEDGATRARDGLAAAGSDARLLIASGDDIHGLGGARSTPDRSSPSSIAGMLPTSGTSGPPKLVELTNQNYVMAGERLARNGGFLTEDRHYLCTPFFHTNGQLYLTVPPFITGGSLALVPRFSASGYFESARRLGATVSSMVAPPMRMALRRAVESGEPVDAGDLRLIQYGMTMSTADWADWDRVVPQIAMRQIYGQTESVTGVLGGSPWDRDDRVTIGRPFVGVPGIRLVGDDGRDVAEGEPGELWVEGTAGSTLMAGYHDAPEATARTIVDDRWLRTGDVMVRHTDGRVEFRGRRLHIIRRGGENLSTYALEIDLQACPLISDVAVTAREDDVLDATVVAHVIPRGGYSEAAFLRWCRDRLGRRSTPDHVCAHTDFPRTASGRVITRDLT